MGVKPTHSRPIDHDEFIQLCIVLLSIIDAESYVRIEPLDRKVADKAREFRSQDVNMQRQRRSSWCW
eukprot:6061189-Amphidinium_carterae.1